MPFSTDSFCSSKELCIPWWLEATNLGPPCTWCWTALNTSDANEEQQRWPRVSSQDVPHVQRCSAGEDVQLNGNRHPETPDIMMEKLWKACRHIKKWRWQWSVDRTWSSKEALGINCVRYVSVCCCIQNTILGVYYISLSTYVYTYIYT